MKNENYRMKAIMLIALLAVAVLPSQLFAQSAATLGGRVMDSSQAVIPGAEVTVINVDTGVETRTTTNNAGVYNFPNLQSGTYRITARAAGFTEKTVTDARLRTGAPATINFEMSVGGITTSIDVSGVAESMLLEAGSSSGTVMQEQLVSELPLVGSNVMELLNSMGGVIKAEEPIFGASQQSFAGISGGSINITRDGVSATDIRYNSGVTSTSYVNQELVGEFKMILSPVDAELGRGAGQVQITTRSGGNEFHGSGVWNVQNTLLDAMKFEDKRQQVTPPWRNVNNYTLSASGPIIRNKTFFFASWDQQIVRNKSWNAAATLTNCARKGIYRYFDGVVSKNPIDSGDYRRYDADEYKENGDFFRYAPFPRRVTVTDIHNGTPILHDQPAGTSGQLYYQSVFGPLTSADRIALGGINEQYAQPGSSVYNDCSGYTPPTGVITGAFDANRNSFDQTGYVNKLHQLMPEANFYGFGDGLNFAAHRWWRTTKGTNNIFGTGEDNRRRQFTGKIDHNLSDAHRLSGTYTIEKNAGEDGGTAWQENSYIGRNWRKPQNLTLSLTSTLAPTLLNEFRFGYNRVTGYVTSSIDSSDGALPPILADLTSGMNLPYNDRPVVVSYNDLLFGPIIGPMINTMSISHPFMSRGLMNNTWGGTDNSYNFSDTVTWIKGAHSFKGGVTVRYNQAWYFQDGDKNGRSYVPGIVTGDMGGTAAMTLEQSQWDWPGIRQYNAGSADNPNMLPGLAVRNGNNNAAATTIGSSPGQQPMVRNMLNYLAGSVNSVQQAFYITKDGGNYRWNDINKGEYEYINDYRSKEISFFFKDDWRVSSDLTLNLGIRYEYFGVPWEANGMTVALAGGNRNIQGDVGPTWMRWLDLDSPTERSRYQFVGPNSDHSDLRPWNKDFNNFAPHVGFSYQLPWWGKGLTTLRGGYSVSYSPITNFDNMTSIIATVPGTTSTYTHTLNNEDATRQYMNLATVNNLIGNNAVITPTMNVMAQILDMSGSVSVYDENLRNPYTHSLNLSVTRQIGRAFTLDVRYIANLSRNLLSATNLNTPNYMSNGLFEEFDTLRKKGAATTPDEIPTIARILNSGPVAIANPVTTIMQANGIGRSGGNIFNNLADGDYNSAAQNLSRYGPVSLGLPGNAIKASSLPDNFIITNPELQNANITTNAGYTNYHSMQAQLTMRPLRGLSFQATYTWSRNIADRGVEDFDTGARRYYLSDQHRSHVFATYGSYTLPFGANGFFFRDASGAFRKAIEGWGLSWVSNISSGNPMSITGGSSRWGINQAEVVRPELWDNKAGKIEEHWNPDGTWSHATFFGDNKYQKVTDPICNTIATELQGRCRTQRYAIALANDPSTIVIRNAEPGRLGNFTPNSLTGPGRWSLDMALSKAVEFMEGKTIDFRLDASNIFNHAMASGTADTWNHAPRYDVINLPQATLNNAAQVGFMATKAGHRTFQGKLSIRF